MSEGYMLMGFGRKYVDECRLAVDMLNQFDTTREKALMTKQEDLEYAQSLGVFDHIAVVDFENEPLLKDEENPHNLYCVISRILMPKFIPFDKAIALDSDIVTMFDPQQVWDYFNATNQPFASCGYEYEQDWHWAQIDEVIEKVGEKVPSIHGGVLYFNKTHADFNKFAEDCKEICVNYDDYNCKRMFRGGMTDEVIFAIAMVKNNCKPLHYVDYPVVSFNLPPNIQLPFYFHTRNGLNLEGTVERTKSPCVFNHIFFHEGNNQMLLQWYLLFYKRIMGELQA